MQVDSKPSPWPCVAMLVALLLFCLTMPRFWQPGNPATNGTAGDETSNVTDVEQVWAFDSTYSMFQAPYAALNPYTALNPLGATGFHELELDLTGRTMADGSLIAICPPPTIDELIETARLGMPVYQFQSGLNGIDFLRGQQFEAPKVLAPEIEWAVPEIGPSRDSLPRRSALVTVVMEQLGRAMAKRSAADVVQPFAAAMARLHELFAPPVPEVLQSQPIDPPPVFPDGPIATQSPSTRNQAEVSSPTVEVGSLAASTLRLVNPGERLAMLPASIPTLIPIDPNDTASMAPAHDEPDGSGQAEPWCVPQTLFEQIERLSHHPFSAKWAQTTIEELRAVTDRHRWEHEDVSSVLWDLSQSAQEATKLANETRDDRLRVELLRAHWGLARRLDCWAALYEIRVARHASPRIAARGSLNSLLVAQPQPTSGDPDASGLSNDLEAYEQSRDPKIGRQVSERQRELDASPSSLDRTLADAVEQHYRNANVRIAITSELLNRLVNKQRTEDRPVRERIAGTRVRGRAQSVSESSIRLQPAERRWQFDVEAQGVVNSRTLADGGRARLHTRSSTDFTAQKTVVVDPSGVRFAPTVVNATNHNRLVGVTTDFDWVPFVGSLARDRAVQVYRARRSRARAEVESKVGMLAVEQIDEETLTAIDRVEQEIQSRLLTPMAECGIDLTPIELMTTDQRLVARLRIAGTHQLGGHTPRPRALSDSLASLQIHESALTNAGVSLGLDAMRCTAPELQAQLRERFPRLALENPPDARRDTVFEFAYRDAVQIRIDDGRVELMIGLSSVELQGRRMENIVVHAFYAPVVEGLDAELVRDGPLGIEGRIGSTDRARLHNVFNTVLSEDRRLPIVRLEKFGDAQLNGLAITQLVLEDGWIGVAIGPEAPERTAENTRSLR
ncbi:MAG TPA: hypothetical protein VGK58_01325 [Lacipirellulaceae bacterium]